VGEFWGLTAFFNPQRYRCRKLLYDIFRENSKRQGLRLLTVELAFEQAPFELRTEDCEVLLQLRATNLGIMWQKERLLNVGLANLPAACDSLVWLDCDVVFDNPNWTAETSELLHRHAVVQPYSMSVRLPRGETSLNIRAANHPSYDRRPSSGYAYTYGQAAPLTDYMSVGHTGFAWAARRTLFDDIGLYDKMIVGGGDVILACGFYGRPANRFTHLLPLDLVNDQQAWIKAMSARVRGSVTFTRGGLLHLWHGTPRSRRTVSRFRLLTKYSFDPSEDLKLSSQGFFIWAGNKPGLRKAVARHFWLRNEDGDTIREQVCHLGDNLVDLRRRLHSHLSSHFTKLRVSADLAFLSFSAPERRRLSLIIMNWKRPQMVTKIVERYSNYSIIGDIIVWNNNFESTLDFKNLPNVKVVICKHDAGLDSRWAAGILADQEHLLVHDDDLILTEKSLKLLFHKYLRNPELCHGICGRNLADRYIPVDSFGPVDVALTTCLIINRRYIGAYFQHVQMFDDLRNYGCGNGEDILMNWVVRGVTGKKNMAHRIPFADSNKDSAVSLHSIGRRPGHLSVRNEIARRCVQQLTKDKVNLRVENFGLDELSRMFPAVWPRYHREPETVISNENFVLTRNVSIEKFSRALSLLCRRDVSISEIAPNKCA
jgi:hypothetical protein